MKLEAVLEQLDETRDASERLIGADWLQDNDYPDEASFYRWLIINQREPFRPYVFYRWLRQEDPGVITWRHLQEKAVIHEAPIWRLLIGQGIEQYLERVICYNSRIQAVTALRLAYVNCRKQGLLFNNKG